MASDFIASGVGSASATGAAIAASPFAVSGVGAAAATGKHVKQTRGSAAGVTGGTVVARKAGVGAASGSGVTAATAVGSAIRRTAGASAGLGAAGGTGAPAGVASTSGTSAANALQPIVDGAAAGTSSAAGKLSAVNVSVAGVGAAAAASKRLWGGAGVSHGAATGAGVGGVSWDSLARETGSLLASHGLVFVQTGHATSDASAQTAIYTSRGAVTDAIVLQEKRRSVGTAAGTSSAKSYTVLVETLQSSAAASATETATIKATEVSTAAASNELAVVQRVRSVAAAACTSNVSARAIGGTIAVGAAAGQSSTSWKGRGVIAGDGAAAGAGVAQAVLLGLARRVARAAGTGAASGVRKGRQQEILVSTGEAENSVLFPLPAVYPVFWSNTIGASGATWDGLPFNSMIEVDGVVYAASVAGLFKLDDVADDNGTPVLSNVEWDLADRSDYKQRARSVYVHAVADGPFTVTVENKQGEFSYQTHLPASSKPMNHRAAIGRGLTSRAMRLSLQQNRYFAAGDVNLESGDTTRRI